MEVGYRWVDGPTCTQEDWDAIETVLVERGWMSLNRATTRILFAEDGAGALVGFHVFQLIPYCGPLYVVAEARGTGIAEKLADEMLDFLAEVHVRGFITVADSPHSQKLCKMRGMTEIESPVFAMGGKG
jgi:hypothetical protein